MSGEPFQTVVADRSEDSRLATHDFFISIRGSSLFLGAPRKTSRARSSFAEGFVFASVSVSLRLFDNPVLRP